MLRLFWSFEKSNPIIGLTSQPRKVAFISLKQHPQTSVRKHIQFPPFALFCQSRNTDTVAPTLQNLFQIFDRFGTVKYLVFLL